MCCVRSKQVKCVELHEVFANVFVENWEALLLLQQWLIRNCRFYRTNSERPISRTVTEYAAPRHCATGTDRNRKQAISNNPHFWFYPVIASTSPSPVVRQQPVYPSHVQGVPSSTHHVQGVCTLEYTLQRSALRVQQLLLLPVRGSRIPRLIR